jgi:hypothetical protein
LKTTVRHFDDRQQPIVSQDVPIAFDATAGRSGQPATGCQLIEITSVRSLRSPLAPLTVLDSERRSANEES